MDAWHLTYSSKGEDQILASARHVCEELGAPELKPTKITWAWRSQIIVYSDSIELPKRYREYLTAEDWEPLIASALIYTGLLGKMRLGAHALKQKTFLFGMLLPVALWIPIFVPSIILLERLPRIYTDVLVPVELGLWLSFLLLSIRHFYVQSLIDLRFQADKQTADSFGRDRLIQVLRKIDQAGVDRRTSLVRRLDIVPPANQRIDKLQQQGNFGVDSVRLP